MREGLGARTFSVTLPALKPATSDLTRSRDSGQVRARTLNTRRLRVGCVALWLASFQRVALVHAHTLAVHNDTPA